MSDAPTSIVRAATRCIAERGIRGVRVTDVAARAGVSTGLIYYHFTDRAGLLSATLDHINAEFERGASGPDARAALLAELADGEAVRQSSIAWNELRASAIFDQTLAPAVSAATGRWNLSIAAALGVGGADADAEILTSLVEGLAARWLSGSISRARAVELLSRAIESLIDHPDHPSRTQESP